VQESRPRTQFTPERWRQLQDLFERALCLDPSQREQFLHQQCADDNVLRDQVVSLLRASSSDDEEFERGYERSIGNLLRESGLPSGTRIGRYRIQRLLGRGGMGAVYLAERADEQYQQTVALKLVELGILHSDIGDRFLGERQILARLNHPNIARLFDGGRTDDGLPYFVMEYVAGVPIDRYCQEHELQTRDRLRLMKEVCAAVQYAHQNLIIHRDLKPSNILVGEDGRPKLLDFGIAKLLEPETPGAALTRLRERVMTPEHASPEQIRGEPTATVSDVYSLGVLLYQLLTGEHPYTSPTQTLRELERRVCEEDPQTPSARVRQSPRTQGSTGGHDLARELAGDLDTIVLKAMQRDPVRRYHSAAALARDIQNYLDGMPLEARPDTFSYRAGKFLRRHKWAAVGTAASLALIVGLTTFYTRRLATERDHAQIEATKAKQVADLLAGIFRRANPWGAQGKQISAVEVLDRGARDIEVQLHDQPVLLAELLFNIGKSYHNLADFERADRTFARVLELESAAGLNDTVEHARTLYEIANTRRSEGQYREAEVDYKEALQLQRRLFPGPNEETSATLSHLGTLYYDTLRWQEALPLQREALDMAIAADGRESEQTADCMNNLALTLQGVGQFPQAERMFREMMQIQRRVMPPLHPDVLGDKFNLALLLYAVGHYSAAETLMRELVPQRRAVLGKDHPSVGYTLNGLASVLTSLGKFDEAEQLLNEAGVILRNKLPPNHFRIGNVERDLGRLATARGDYARAEPHFQTAVDIYSKALGDTNLTLYRVHSLMAAALLDMGRIPEAQPLIEGAYQRMYGDGKDPGNVSFDLTLEQLGRLRITQDRLDEAASLFQQALARYRDQGMGNHPNTCWALMGLAQVALLRNRPAEAQTDSQLALENLRRELPEDHWQVALARASLERAQAAAHGRRDVGRIDALRRVDKHPTAGRSSTTLQPVS
jgi:tetratricopeptide (TPR) repeat protein